MTSEKKKAINKNKKTNYGLIDDGPEEQKID